jgi:hypothetical protein
MCEPLLQSNVGANYPAAQKYTQARNSALRNSARKYIASQNKNSAPLLVSSQAVVLSVGD